MTTSGDNYEELMAAAAGRIEAVRDLSGQLGDLRGEGAAADGKVKVTVLPGGTLENVELEPRAMKLQSHELAEAIVEAARAATIDATRKSSELMESVLPGAGSAMVDMADPDAIASGRAASEETVNSIIDSLRRGM